MMAAASALVATAVVAALASAIPAAAQQGHLAAHPGVRHSNAGIIATVAGGVGGPGKATSVPLRALCDVAFGNGSMYVSTGLTVYKVSPQTGGLAAVAGDGIHGLSAPDGPLTTPTGLLGDGGLATSATLNGSPTRQNSLYNDACARVAVDHSRNLVIADAVDHRVRVVAASTQRFYGQAMIAGHIYTVAGGGADTREGAVATLAGLVYPAAVAVDAAGNLVIAEAGDNLSDPQVRSRVRVVAASTGHFYGQGMTAGHIYTVAGGGSDIHNGEAATAARLGVVLGVAVDGAGNLMLADQQDNRVRVVAARDDTFYGQAMTAGDIYTVAGTGTAGPPSENVVGYNSPVYGASAVAVDGAGNLVIADTWNSRIRVVAVGNGHFYGKDMTAGYIYTVAGTSTSAFHGDNGPAIFADLAYPTGVAIDGAGNLLIADHGDTNTSTFRARVVAASDGTFYGKPMTEGYIYTVAGNGEGTSAGNGMLATRAEIYPAGITTDIAGNWLIADMLTSRIRVVAASTGTIYGQAMTAGHVYTVAGNGQKGYARSSGENVPATKTKLNLPASVTVDTHGNLIIADSYNSRVRVVIEESSGTSRYGTYNGQPMAYGNIYTIAGGGKGGTGDNIPGISATLTGPAGVAVDDDGNVLIAEPNNHKVRMLVEDPAGTTRYGDYNGQPMAYHSIYTIAGNGTAGNATDGTAATSAALHSPTGVTVDHVGNVLIADHNNSQIRVVAALPGGTNQYGPHMDGGDIYTIAGTGTAGYNGDGIQAAGAELNIPFGVSVDGDGNVLIADTGNDLIRVLAVQQGSFYGLQMAAGYIYRLAGSTHNVNGAQVGYRGFYGDGGPAHMAQLDSPWAVAPNGPGNVLIADSGNSRIR